MRASSNFEPSSGGTGMRLKIASTTLIITIITATDINAGGKASPSTTLGASRTIKLKMKATTRLVAGPAKATHTGPHLPPRRLYGLYGTGLAQPKTNWPAVVKYNMRGKTIEPVISMWAKGLRVSRPAYLAVGSPSE